jgi:hypothetical protein
MASNTGTIEIDFGANPGLSEQTAVVTGQSAISATSNVEAWIMSEASTNHTANDQSWVTLFCALTCGIPTAATGFTIYAKSTEKLTGKFKIRWVWSD